MSANVALHYRVYPFPYPCVFHDHGPDVRASADAAFSRDNPRAAVHETAGPATAMTASLFDFDATVLAPFRMQPGLRRITPGTPHLTPLRSGTRHLREKLAVLGGFSEQALCSRPGFDAQPALETLYQHAAAEHPAAWAWDGRQISARLLGVSVGAAGDIAAPDAHPYSTADDVRRCLLGLQPAQRQAGLLSLAFAEDFAIWEAEGDTPGGTLPWLAVALPSHWAPEDKVGLPWATAHGPVADNAVLLQAARGLATVATRDDGERYERFVWTVSGHNRLHAHPLRVDPDRWQHTPVAQAWWRTERQTFIPVPGRRQAVFTIRVDVEPLADAVAPPGRAARLREALASMSDEALAYRGLLPVRAPLLAWLDACALA